MTKTLVGTPDPDDHAVANTYAYLSDDASWRRPVAIPAPHVSAADLERIQLFERSAELVEILARTIITIPNGYTTVNKWLATMNAEFGA